MSTSTAQLNAANAAECRLYERRLYEQQKKRRCSRCDGTGTCHVHGIGMTTCPECNGRGK